MLEPGSIVAGYRIEGLVGEGGMGVVYEATQLSFDRTVALKLISRDLSRDPEFSERFRREGTIQAALDHPHIITVYDGGETEYGLYIAMKLVRGPSLRDLIWRGELDDRRMVKLLTQTADALDAAHDAGLIHRDIKPSNILVEAHRDHAYLADFGITKAPDRAPVTRTGVIVGTPDYMAPEQAGSKPATAQSDIYALGVVVYECLTRKLPYSRDSDIAVLIAHMHDPVPSVLEERPDLPPEVDAVIRRALAKDAAQRHPTASALILDLADALDQADVPAVAPPPPGAVAPATLVRPADAGADGGGGAAPAPLAPGPPAPETRLKATAPVVEPPTAPAPSVDAPPPDPVAAPQPVTPVGEVQVPVEGPPVAPLAPTVLASGAEPITPVEAGPADQPTVEASGGATAAPPTLPSPTPVPGGPAAEGSAGPTVVRPREPTVARAGGRKRAFVGVGAAVVLVGVVAGGFLAGHGSSGSGSGEATPAAPAVTTASAGGFSVTVPEGWRRATSAPVLPGIEVSSPLALESARGTGAGLIAGRVADATWPTFLPPALQRRLRARARAEKVRLGDTTALRYSNLEPDGYDGVVNYYVLPQAGRSAALACFAKRSAAARALPACEQIVASAKLPATDPYPLDVPAAYGSAVNSTITRLNSARKDGARRIRGGKTASAQADAARDVAGAYEAALAKLARAKVTPYVNPANARIVAALTRARDAYRALAAAATPPPGSSAKWKVARQRVLRQEASLRAALTGLAALGFTF